MKNKKINIFTTIISIAMTLVMFLGSVRSWCFNEYFYENEHNKILLSGKHINEYIGITNEELKELTSFTLNYLNDADASLDLKMNIKGIEREVFTDDEKMHMEDVRKLNLTANYIYWTCIVILVICALVLLVKGKNIFYYFYKNYKKILIFTLTIFAFIGIWILIDFDSFWTLFHHIFFTGNDLWLLDLRKDILIMIVPPEFFNHLVIRILIRFVLDLFISYTTLYFINRKELKHD